MNSGGFGPGILQNFITSANQPLNSLVQTAAPGQAITLWGTGLGPVSAGNVAPTPGNLPTKVEIFVGGVLATSLYGGRSPLLFRRRSDRVDRSRQRSPRLLRSGASPNRWRHLEQRRYHGDANRWWSVLRSGQRHRSPFAKGGNVGAVIPLREMLRTDVDTSQPTDISFDLAAISFRAAPGGPFFFNSALSAPPLGACTMYFVAGGSLTLDLPGYAGGLGNDLDAGPAIAINGVSQVSPPGGRLIIPAIWGPTTRVSVLRL